MRPGYGSRWNATPRPAAAAASSTAGSLASVETPCESLAPTTSGRPHHETTATVMPASTISANCAASTVALADEYGPRSG